ncbi:MAG: hypothetical protein JSU82_10840 [Rhodospirillales bacterium]|nr:MAG: hypothetical protein JSU82_10840 [Rhodospirillales bacterium]
MIRRTFWILTLVLTAAPGPALAAPQILGLIATGEVVPMQCANGSCTALLSAFCLQEQRLPPDFETPYRPERAETVTLAVTTADGQVRRLDAGDLVQFRSRYGYTAIRADLVLAALGDLRPVAVALEVAPRATMLPVPQPGDPDPLTAAEIAFAAGPLRMAAESVLEGESEPARTARIAAGLINALPLEGDITVSARAGLWGRIAGSDAPAAARRMFKACGRAVDQAVGYSLRKCLEERHERLQIETTREYWDSLAGS